ncbi:CoA pyrophosphatase [Rhodospirillum centenum]|uniref:Nudix family hydrolase, putative n=1 Tax=Rhodospirillum centenum (strain ATCC 51521 / SW) TaxID=414684 RepID=B6IWV1_RHOCS|nr:CoA pyrophosphatase [Rhodospirillum centenum]ACJ00775.1 nudix family hydrolase, putative [Rhodospirillum centenum SW]
MERRDLLSPGQPDGLITEADIRARFLRRPGQPGRIIGVRGDHEGNPGMGTPAALREAAVLVPLIDRDAGVTVLLTQRTAHLAAHAGQISFPGGGVEPADTGPEDTALRETEEEVGLPRTKVDLIGRLDTYVTRTGFRVTPVVGIIRPPFTLNAQPDEVADVFEVPLAFILGPGGRERRSAELRGTLRHFWVVPYQDRFIWGATAGMLVNLCEVLTGEGADPAPQPA